MERIFNNVISRFIVASTLLAIVIMFHISTTMFYHVHEIDGVRVVHSHIYSHSQSDTDTAAGEQEHTDNELTLIEHLNNITIITSERVSLPEVAIRAEYYTLSFSLPEPICGSLFSRDSSRAPPSIAA